MFFAYLWPVFINFKIEISYSEQSENESGILDNVISGTAILIIEGNFNGKVIKF
jgi:hypothetical protein